jgi:hypothetical protein
MYSVEYLKGFSDTCDNVLLFGTPPPFHVWNFALCYFHLISKGIEKEKQKILLERQAFLHVNLDFSALDHVLKFKIYCVDSIGSNLDSRYSCSLQSSLCIWIGGLTYYHVTSTSPKQKYDVCNLLQLKLWLIYFINLVMQILPVNIKGLAGSVATLGNWMTAWVVTMTANLLLDWSSAGLPLPPTLLPPLPLLQLNGLRLVTPCSYTGEQNAGEGFCLVVYH